MTARRFPAWRVAAAVAGFLLVGPATAEEPREVGEAVQMVGEVDFQENGGSPKPLKPMKRIASNWALLTGKRSALTAKIYPRAVLLLGSGTRVEVGAGQAPAIKGCPGLVKIDSGHMRLSIEPGVRLHFDCFEVVSRDVTVEALATDFALVVHRLYGTWVTVLAGRVAIRPAAGSDAFELKAGEVALVRGKRVWRGHAVEPGSAPPGAPPLPPAPDPPLLPNVDPLPRSP